MTPDTTSIERIAFQHNSQLASKIISICEDFLKWAEKTKQSRIVDGKVLPVTHNRMKEVMDYSKNIFSPELSKIVFNELNMNFLIVNSSDLIISFMCASGFRKLSKKQHKLAADLYPGTTSLDNLEIDLNIFDDLITEIDLNKSKHINIDNDYFSCVTLFPVIFLGSEAIVNMEPATAREIASVIIHEIGHGFCDYEHLTDIFYRAEIATNSVKNFNNENNIAKSLKIINDLKNKEKCLPDKERDENFRIVLTDIEKQRGLSNLTGLQVIRIPIIYSLAMALLWIFKKLFMASFMRMINDGKYGKLNTSFNKTSDTVVTISNSGYAERIADEFVSRHGLSADLLSFIKKTNFDGSQHYIRCEVTEAIENNRTISFIVSILDSIISFFGILTYVDNNTYDPVWLRLKHILQNNMVVFKDESLSNELREYYIKETKSMIENLDSMMSSKRFKITQLFWGTLLRITSRGSIIDSFNTAGLSKDYDTLQLLTNNLIKNPFFYHAARLKSL